MKNIDRPVNLLNLRGDPKENKSEGHIDEYLEKEHASGEIRLDPFEPISILSKEKIGIDSSLIATIEGRSSLGKMGVFTHFNAGVIDSGFGSENPQRVVFTLMSCNPNPVILPPGQPIAQLLFSKIDGEDGKTTRRTEYQNYKTSAYPEFNDMSRLVNDNIFIGITGLPVTGKSETADILCELLQAESYSMGSIIREETEKRGLEPSGENTNRVSRELRKENGPDIIAKKMVEKIEQKNDYKFNIIEGIRSPDEVEVLKNCLNGIFIMIGMHSSIDTRIKRIEQRDRSDDKGGRKALEKRDQKETRFGVSEALTMSDHIITNEGTFDELRREVEQVVGQILFEVKT